jgi:cytochrome c oxidase assembly factor CtaG
MNSTMNFLLTWNFNLFFLANLLGAAAWYGWATYTVNRRDPAAKWPILRAVSFFTGLTLLAFVWIGPVGAFTQVFFWAHMTQHITIMMVAAPLLVMGGPVTLAFRVASPQTRRTLIIPILRSRIMWWLTNPYLTWVLFAGVLLGTHLTPFYNVTLQHDFAHVFIEQPLYLVAALLYYYPILGGNLTPRRLSPLQRVASLALMMIPEIILGFIIYASPVVLYASYATVDRPFGLDPLSDQQLAGGMMWALGMVIDTIWISLAVAEWFSSEERRTHKVDAQIAAEIEAERQLP